MYDNHTHSGVEAIPKGYWLTKSIETVIILRSAHKEVFGFPDLLLADRKKAL